MDNIFSFSRILWVFVALLVSGCHPLFISGHLSGNLFHKSAEQIERVPVTIEITPKWNQTLYMIEVRDMNQQPRESLQVQWKSPKNLEATFPFLQPHPFRLKKVSHQSKDPDTHCFLHQNKWEIQVCWDLNQFWIQIDNEQRTTIFSLSGHSFQEEPPLILEPSRDYLLNEAIDLSFRQNFDSRMAFEHVVQARHSAKAAYLNLIPHLSTNLIWNADFGFVSAIATFSGLVPFVLPTYWIQAREADYGARIQDDSLTIMRADLAETMEELFYTFDRDTRILLLYRQFLEYLAEVKRILNARTGGEKARALLKSMTRMAKDDEHKLFLLFKSEQYAISQAMGFNNPEAVSSVSLGEEVLPVDQAIPLDQLTIAKICLGRSLELHQFSYLISIAKLKQIEMFFNWIDPTGDPKYGFGFNLIEQIKIARSQIRELEVRREQLKSVIYQNAYRTVLEYNEAIDAYKANITSTYGHSFSPEELAEKLYTEQYLSEADLKEIVANQIGLEIRVTNAVAAFRIARAKIDRLMLDGSFSRLRPQIQDEEQAQEEEIEFLSG